MALPTPSAQRHTDIDLQYDADLPWVQAATIDGADCYVRREYGPDEQWAEVGEAFARAEAVVRIRRADLADPERNQEIVIDGTTWVITGSAGANDYEWRLALESDVTVTFG